MALNFDRLTRGGVELLTAKNAPGMTNRERRELNSQLLRNVGNKPEMSAEEKQAQQDAYYNNEKNKYKRSGGLTVNGREVGGKQYTQGYLDYAEKKNRKYYDELGEKKDRLIAGINDALSKGATSAANPGAK